MITVEKAFQDVVNQLEYFVKESKNRDIEINKLSAKELSESGWIKQRIESVFNENNFTVNQIQKYYEKFCQDEILMELGCIDAQLGDDKIYAKDLIASCIDSIVKASIHLRIYKHLKVLKDDSTP